MRKWKESDLGIVCNTECVYTRQDSVHTQVSLYSTITKCQYTVKIRNKDTLLLKCVYGVKTQKKQQKIRGLNRSIFAVNNNNRINESGACFRK
jgi:hypothetical protein